MKKFILLSTLLLILISCNIFNPSGKGKSAEELEDRYGVEAVILEGKKYMWEDNWIQAARYFLSATQMDSTKSEAWFYLGKSILRIYGIDLTDVWDEIDFDPDSKSDKVPFLFQTKDSTQKIDDELAGGERLESFRKVTIDTIISNKVKNSITIPDTILEISVEDTTYLVKTLIDSVFLTRKKIFDAMKYSVLCLENIYNCPDMDGVITRTQFEPDYFVATSVIAVLSIVDANRSDVLEWSPLNEGDINEREAYQILCEGMKSVSDIDFDGFKELSKNPKEIEGNLNFILQTFGKADESADSFAVDIQVGADKGANISTDMITNITKNYDKVISLLETYYYDDFIDNDGDWYDQTDDSVQNRMIWIDWDHDGKIDINNSSGRHIHIGDDAHRNENPSFYNTISIDTGETPIIDTSIERYKYSGGYCYEFIGGDWGIDEEIMDGEDNDGDGIADEDTRVVGDTLDDDGDWIGNDPSVLFDDTLPTIINPVSGLKFNFTGNFINVPLWPIYKVRHQGASDSLGLIFPDSIPLYTDSIYTGNFIGGDYGMDEEFYDGIDNDGDGLTDEDVGEYLPDESLRDTIISLLTAKGLR